VHLSCILCHDMALNYLLFYIINCVVHVSHFKYTFEMASDGGIHSKRHTVASTLNRGL
jgi:hypothetical protein